MKFSHFIAVFLLIVQISFTQSKSDSSNGLLPVFNTGIVLTGEKPVIQAFNIEIGVGISYNKFINSVVFEYEHRLEKYTTNGIYYENRDVNRISIWYGLLYKGIALLPQHYLIGTELVTIYPEIGLSHDFSGITKGIGINSRVSIGTWPHSLMYIEFPIVRPRVDNGKIRERNYTLGAKLPAGPVLGLALAPLYALWILIFPPVAVH